MTPPDLVRMADDFDTGCGGSVKPHQGLPASIAALLERR
jgi:hypothetical protein